MMMMMLMSRLKRHTVPNANFLHEKIKFKFLLLTEIPRAYRQPDEAQPGQIAIAVRRGCRWPAARRWIRLLHQRQRRHPIGHQPGLGAVKVALELAGELRLRVGLHRGCTADHGRIPGLMIAVVQVEQTHDGVLLLEPWLLLCGLCGLLLLLVGVCRGGGHRAGQISARKYRYSSQINFLDQCQIDRNITHLPLQGDDSIRLWCSSW